MDTFFSIVFIALGLWMLYFIIRMAIDSARIGVRQAKLLEDEFGTDVVGAMKYQFLNGELKKSKDVKEEDRVDD